MPSLLKAIAFGIFFFPSSMVLAPVGAAGTLPMLLALLLFGLWLGSVLLGLHNPLPMQHPGRFALAALLVGTCASYAALYLGMTGESTDASRASADRWMMLMMAASGIILVTAEVTRTLDDALSLVRSLLAGALFCCAVAAVQFFVRVNPMDWFQALMPGFTDNGAGTTFQQRGTLVRVAGSTFHSIELAVVSAMLLPLSIWRAVYDKTGRKWVHWVGTALLVFAIAATISRSGVLGLLIGLAIFIPFLPALPKRWTLVLAPIAVIGLFLTVPGLIATLTDSFTAGENDPSISTRTNNYPRVAAMLDQHPFLGVGPGSYLPNNALYILDNEYLNAAVSMGGIGLACMTIFLVLPGLAALQVARLARSQSLKCLAGAVSAGGLVAAVGSFTFDSMSFPVFAIVYPFYVGLSGAVWIMGKRQDDCSESPIGTDRSPEGLPDA